MTEPRRGILARLRRRADAETPGSQIDAIRGAPLVAGEIRAARLDPASAADDAELDALRGELVRELNRLAARPPERDG